MKICTVGLGYVGLTLSVAMVKSGLEVCGVDKNQNYLKSLSEYKSNIEPEDVIPVLKKDLGKSFKICDTIDNHFDVFLMAVGTPLSEKKEPVIDFLKSASHEIGEKLQKGNLIIVRSTVPVGTTRNEIIPILEKISELKAGQDYEIAYAPERTIEGEAIKEIQNNPQVIGGFNQKSLERATEFFSKFTKTIVPVSNIETAEMIKLLDNTYRDAKFAFANEIAMICEALKLNAHECIAKANQGYKRNNIPIPSPGVGGPCLSKDPHILNHVSTQKGHQSDIIKNSRYVNEFIPVHLASRVTQKLKQIKDNWKDSKILIMGFAFKGKPETPDIRNSSTITLLDELKKEFKRIYAHDPVVPAEDLKNLGLEVVNSEQGFEGADCVIIMNNHEYYENLDVKGLLGKTAKPCLFVDCWNLHPDISEDSNVIYSGVGLDWTS